jgi:hypothetical protein
MMEVEIECCALLIIRIWFQGQREGRMTTGGLKYWQLQKVEDNIQYKKDSHLPRILTDIRSGNGIYRTPQAWGTPSDIQKKGVLDFTQDGGSGQPFAGDAHQANPPIHRLEENMEQFTCKLDDGGHKSKLVWGDP